MDTGAGTGTATRAATRVVTTPGHRRDIQGLRALAVLLVIADHAGAGRLTGGFVGVDVFFVVSGYLITRLLLDEVARTGRVDVAAFYARRARRILPAATTVLLATLAYAAWELSLSRVQQLRDDAVWSALFAANIHFARLGTDYFAQGREPSPFQHYWSLAVEEQFYLVWPLLLAAVVVGLGRRAPRTLPGSASSQGPARLTLVLVLLVGASLVWSVLSTRTAPGTAYFSSPARAWELGAGALLAVQLPRLTRVGGRARFCLSAVGLSAIGVAAVAYDPTSAFPGWRALLPVLGTAAVLAAGATAAPNRVLGSRPLTWVGDLSYSLYLWHWPILVLGAARLEAQGEGLGEGLGARSTALLLLLTLLASTATYYLVENPFRRARTWRRSPHALALWPVALALVLVGVSAAEGTSQRMLAERMGGRTDATAEALPQPAPGDPALPGGRTAPPEQRADLRDRLEAALSKADSGAEIPFPLTNLPHPSPDVLRLPLDCLVDPAETSTPLCPAGDTRSRRTVVLLGDSQAGQWVPVLDELGKRHGLRVLPVIKLGCPPFDVPVVDGGGADFWQCTQFRDWAVDVIADSRAEVVVVGSEATSYRLRAAPGRDLATTWTAGAETMLARLRGLGPQVVVVGDTPDLSFDPVDCLTAPDARLDDCVGGPHAGLLSANALTRAAAERTGAGYVDPLPLLCVEDRCPLVLDRTLTFRDYSHISADHALALTDDFEVAYDAALQRAGAPVG